VGVAGGGRADRRGGVGVGAMRGRREREEKEKEREGVRVFYILLSAIGLKWTSIGPVH